LKVEDYKKKGLSVHKVEVTKHGKIDGACKGKNKWDNAIRGLTPHILNITIVKV
jgi:hypothetical protein